MNEQALQLEKSPGEAETIRSLRRTVHTLKGDAAACGYRELSELAHEFEDVLMLESAAAAAAVPDIALSAADMFAAMIKAYGRREKLPDCAALHRAIVELAPNDTPITNGTKTASGGRQQDRGDQGSPRHYRARSQGV